MLLGAGGHHLAMAQIQHGTATGYEAGGCRCRPCRDAAMAARRKVRRRRRELVADGSRPVAHGTWAGYLTDKCRCPECKAFRSEYMKAYRARKAAAGRTGPESDQQLA